MNYIEVTFNFSKKKELNIKMKRFIDYLLKYILGSEDFNRGAIEPAKSNLFHKKEVESTLLNERTVWLKITEKSN